MRAAVLTSIAAALLLISSPAIGGQANPLIWTLSETGENSYTMRMGARLAGLPEDWDTSFGTDVRITRKPADYRGEGRPRPASRNGSRLVWGQIALPETDNLLFGWDDARLRLRHEPSLNRGRIDFASARNWFLSSDLNARYTSGYALLYDTSDDTVTRWHAESRLVLTSEAFGTRLEARSWRSQDDPLSHGAMAVEQDILGLGRLSASVDDVFVDVPVRRLRFSRRIADDLGLSATVVQPFSAMPSFGLRAEHELFDDFILTATVQDIGLETLSHAVQARYSYTW